MRIRVEEVDRANDTGTFETSRLIRKRKCADIGVISFEEKFRFLKRLSS